MLKAPTVRNRACEIIHLLGLSLQCLCFQTKLTSGKRSWANYLIVVSYDLHLPIIKPQSIAQTFKL